MLPETKLDMILTRHAAVTAELARRQVIVADLRIEGRSLDSAYVALTGRTMDM